MAYTKRQTRFSLQYIQQNLGTGLDEKDERTLMEKAQDAQIDQDRLTINSALSIQAGYQFIAELDTAEDRNERQAIIEKWRVYAALEIAYNDCLKHGTISQIHRYRLSKAVVAAREIGWTVEFDQYGTEIKSVYWK